jgi:hypothetical protein
MYKTYNKNTTFFGIPIETIIEVEDNGEKVEVIAVPYEQFISMKDETNALLTQKNAMQQSMRDMADEGHDLTMFKDHTWFPDDLWEPSDNGFQDDWDPYLNENSIPEDCDVHSDFWDRNAEMENDNE